MFIYAWIDGTHTKQVRLSYHHTNNNGAVFTDDNGCEYYCVHDPITGFYASSHADANPYSVQDEEDFTKLLDDPMSKYHALQQ